MSKSYKVCFIISLFVLGIFPRLIELADELGAEPVLILVAIMANCLIINPLYFFALGIIAGQEIKRVWSLPIVSAIIYAVAHVLANPKEWSFALTGASGNLIISIVTMLITWLVVERKQLKVIIHKIKSKKI